MSPALAGEFFTPEPLGKPQGEVLELIQDLSLFLPSYFIKRGLKPGSCSQRASRLARSTGNMQIRQMDSIEKKDAVQC